MLCVACQSTNLAIRSEIPALLSPGGTAVRVSSFDRDVCVDADLHSGQTDSQGRMRFWSEACGRVRVVASRVGLLPEERDLDTCSRTLVDFRMRPWPEPKANAEPAALATLEFIEALARQDWPAVQQHLIDSDTVPLYRGPEGVRRSSAATGQSATLWRIEVLAVHDSGATRAVDVALAYDDGCESTWRIALSTRQGAWLVDRMAPLMPARLKREAQSGH